MLGSEKEVWDNYSIDYYFKINDKPEKSEKLKDKPLFPIHEKCSGKSPKTAFAPSFASAPKTVQGAHLRLISKSDNQALALEAIDDKPQTYAWLSNWYGDDEYSKNELGCSPSTLIKVYAFKPSSNIIIQNKIQPNLDAVRERCKEENSKNECGTIDEMVAAYEKRGLKILIQGAEMLHFPDDTLAEGDYLTVMGKEGNSDQLVTLITYTGYSIGKGITRLYKRD